MAGAAQRQVQLITPAKDSNKRRKLSGREKAHGVDLLLAGTADADKAYISRVLEEKPAIVPYLASVMRDGTLEAALLRQDAVQKEQFAPSSVYMKHAGIKFLRQALMQMEPTIFNERLWEENRFSMLDCLCLVCYASGCAPECFLPHREQQTALTVLTAEYRSLGQRLSSLDMTTGWAGCGYYRQVPGALNKVVCRLAADAPTVAMPMPHEAMQGFDDWVIESNWSKDAKLKSKKALIEFKIYDHFKKQFGAEIDGIIPKERYSFESDRSSPPPSLELPPSFKRLGKGSQTKQKKTSSPKKPSSFSVRPPKKGNGKATAFGKGDSKAEP
eukprot:2949965-Amphidinium_carterae.1